MTQEERSYAILEDIQEIELACPHCQARVSWPLRKSLNIPDRCPNCSEVWFQMNDPRRKALLMFAEVVKETESMFKEGNLLRFRVRSHGV